METLFFQKNNSNDGTYEIDLGLLDATKIGRIKTWNGMNTLYNWKGDTCNKIVGTDGTIFRPYLNFDDVQSVHVYNTDACRYEESD